MNRGQARRENFNKKSDMKSCYFTDKTIDAKSHEMLQTVRDFVQIQIRPYHPRRSALLILDMQKIFLEAHSHAFVPSARAVIPRIRALAEAYRDRNFPVILTRHINSDENAGLMALWWKDLIYAHSEVSTMDPIFQISNALVIEKSQYDGFYKTELENILRQRNITQIVITGVMTHLCCESTARSAFVRGFEVFFPIDGTATYNEDFHRASLMTLSHGFVMPVLMKELQKQVESSDRDAS